MSNVMIAAIASAAALVAFFLGWLISRRIGEIKVGKAEELAGRL
jgi:high-affinity Fe2+/Pb2+ permease